MKNKKLLYIVPHDFVPAENGGQLRVKHILSALATQFDTTIVYFSEQEHNHLQVSSHFPDSEVIQISHSHRKYSFLHKLSMRIALRTFTGLDISSIAFYELMQSKLRYKHFDLVMFEHLESLHFAGNLCIRYFPHAYRIINLHNIDHELWAAEYANFPHKPQLLKYSKKALKAEKQLFKNVHIALVCSPDDAQKIKTLNSNKLKTLLIPNGTSIPEIHNTDKRPNSLLFVGSLDYFPNIEGLRWFYTKVWPSLLQKIPSVTLRIVGRGNLENISFIQHPNIEKIGHVASVSEYYFSSRLSIVPLLDGSGTRLKIPEAMAHNVPVVATYKGAEGNAYTHNENIIMAQTPAEFADGIIALLTSDTLYDTIKNNARAWVNENLDWKMIGEKLLQDLNHCLKSTPNK